MLPTSKLYPNKLAEDAPTNNVGGGAIPGAGVGPNGEAIVRKKASNKYKEANEKGLETTSLLRRNTLKESFHVNFKVGVVGFSAGKFNVAEAQNKLAQGLATIQQETGKRPTEIVSGLTNVGVPELAYKWASTHNANTVGIACSKATTFQCFPVDKKIIIGTKWGDESQTFVDYCDALIRIGGGEQSHTEVKMFKQQKPNAKVVELELTREN